LQSKIWNKSFCFRKTKYYVFATGGTVLHPEELLRGVSARMECPLQRGSTLRTEEESQPGSLQPVRSEPPQRSSLAARLEHLSLESCDFVTEAGVKFILGKAGPTQTSSVD